MADPTVESLIGDLVDAGATDAEIDEAVKQFKAKGSQSSVLPAMRSGPQPTVHHDAKGSYITDDPNDVSEPGVAQRMLESGAGLDPSVGLLGDARALGAPAGMAMKGLMRIMPDMSGVRAVAGKALHGLGAIAESPAVNIALSPKMGYIGKGLNALGDMVNPAEAVVSPNAGGRLVKVPIRPVEQMLNEARALPPEARLSAGGELPPAPTQTPSGRPSVTAAAQQSMLDHPAAQPGRSVQLRPPTPVVAKPSSNVGGRLVTGAPRVSAEESMARALQEVVAPEPVMSVELPPGPENLGYTTPTVDGPRGRLVPKPSPLSTEDALAQALREPAGPSAAEVAPPQTMTPTGRPSITPAAQAEMAANPLAQAGRTTGRLDRVTQAIQDQRPPLSPLEQQGVRAAAPAEAPVQPSAQPSASPLEAAAMGRLEKVPVSSVRPSKSSGSQGMGSQPSATPGLTVNDMSVIGINPSVRLTKLTPEMADAIDIARAQRHESYAQTARELRKQMADLK